MLLAPHIPKTGGCTFLQVLKKVFGLRLLHYHRWKQPRLSLPSRWLSQVAGRKGLVPAWTRCIFGHFHLQRYHEHFPNADCLTWLREPAERVASEYYYLKRYLEAQGKPDFTNQLPFRLLIEQKLSLAEWNEVSPSQNLQSNYLAGKPIEEFVFVGITEDFDASIELFVRMFGRRRTLFVEPKNTNPERGGGRYPLEPGLRQAILQKNAKDVDLYQRGLAHFLSLCRKYDVKTLLSQTAAIRAAA